MIPWLSRKVNPMATDKLAVCLYLSATTNGQIDQLADSMSLSRSNVVAIAVANMLNDQDALSAAVQEIVDTLSKQEKELPEDKKELYNILLHIKDAMEIQLHLVTNVYSAPQTEHEIKLYNMLIDRAKHGMAMIKKK
jgi:predicted transcriptional regulator